SVGSCDATRFTREDTIRRRYRGRGARDDGKAGDSGRSTDGGAAHRLSSLFFPVEPTVFPAPGAPGAGGSARAAEPRRTHSTCGANAIASSTDRKSTRLNSSHQIISYAVFCLKK